MSLLVKIGTWCLETAVLRAMPKDKSKIRTAEISRKIGVYRDRKNHSGNDWLTQQILANLNTKGKIVKDDSGNKKEHGWRLK